MGCRLQTKGFSCGVFARPLLFFARLREGFIGLSKFTLGDFFMLKNGVKGLFFSDLILKASHTKRIAYIGVMTAFSVITNMLLEFKMMDIQFSLTILVSSLLGVLLGSACGFTACVVGDLVGFLFNSGGTIFMPWVGLSTGMIAFISGFIVNGFDLKVKGQIYIKLTLVFLLSFIVCTVGINSTGFYLYNKKMGFSEAVMNYVATRFGRGTDFIAYLAYRLFFKGQIYNNIFNYAVGFVFIPLVLKSKAFNKE